MLNLGINCILLFVLFFSISTCRGTNTKVPPQAVKGLLDLRQWNFTTDGVVSLDGEWEFFPNEFKNANDFIVDRLRNDQIRSEGISLSSSEEIKFIRVPGAWNDFQVSDGEPNRTKPMGAKGYGTYRLKILLPENFESNEQFPSNPLTLKIPSINTAYKMYVNGQLFASAGAVGKSKEEMSPEYSNKVVVLAKASEYELIIQSSNYYHAKGGLRKKTQLGNYQSINSIREKNLSLDLILFGSLFLMGFYHLGLYWLRRKDKSTLHFGIFCLIISLRSIFGGGENYFYNLVFWIPWEITIKIEYLVLSSLPIFFVNFIYSIFPEEMPKKFVNGILVICIGLSTFILFAPSYNFTQFLIAIEILYIFGILEVLYVVVNCFVRNRPGAKLFVFGFISFACIILNDILHNNNIISTGFFAPLGFLIFIFSQSSVLSTRFSGALTEVEKLSGELSQLSNKLEQKISTGINERQKYSKILLELSKSKIINQFGMNAAIEEITEAIVKTLQIERASIWIYDDLSDHLKCRDLYDVTNNTHKIHMSYKISDFPIYFQYFFEGKILMATNVYEHPAEIEFNEIYHRPNNIQSIIEMPFFSIGKFSGMIVCEKVHTQRDWTKEEESFVSSIASIVSNIFEADIRQKTLLELNKTKSEVDAQNHFTYLINSHSNLNDIFIEISKFIYHKYKISGAWLLLPDEKKENLVPYKAYSYHKLKQVEYEYLKSKKIPLNKSGGIINKSFERQKPFYLPKISNFDFAIDKEIVEILNINSFLLVPLISKNQTVGILLFSNLRSKLILDKQQMRSISNLCAQISGVIETTYLLEQVEKAKRQTLELNHLIKILNEHSNIEEIMKTLSLYIKDKYGLPYYLLTVLDSNENILKYSQSYLPDYLSKDELEVMKKISLPINSSNEDSLHIQALRSKKPKYIPDAVSAIKTDSGKYLLSVLKHKSFVTLPIILQNQPIAMLDLVSLESVKLSEENLIELSILAEQLAGIINGSLLMKKIQEEKQRVELQNIEIEKLAESRKRLSVVGQMVAGIVHDIKNPITSIKALTERLSSDKVSPEKKEKNAKLVLKEMDRLNDLVYEILDFSKGKLSLELEKVNIREFLLEVNEFLRTDFEYGSVESKLNFEYSGEIVLDPSRMRRVLVNLSKNAIEAMYDGNRDYYVKISTKLDKGNLLILVEDNGPGLPESFEQKIFEAFATEGKEKGTGLGLFMSKWIVEVHNGSLTYITERGVGTTFIIELPMNEINLGEVNEKNTNR